MRKRIALLVTALVMVLMVAFAGMALAAQTVTPGNGNPDTNPTGQCAPGQNQETSPGGLKKCP